MIRDAILCVSGVWLLCLARVSPQGRFMNLYDNAYSAFMLDYAVGALSPAEKLAADLHRALSSDGRQAALALDALGGMMLEAVGAAPGGGFKVRDPGDQAAASANDPRLAPYIDRDLLALPWRRSLFGMKTRDTDLPLASLLRLDPGEHAPRHGHGRRDVTVVLTGAFADDYGVYERGDLAFAEPGIKHQPRAVGDAPCVCLIATEPGRPLRGLLGLFGWSGAKAREAA